MSGATLRAITAFRLTCADPESLVPFYAALGFTAGEAGPIPAAEMALLGLAGGGRRIPLQRDGRRLDLDAFDVPGRPYPAGTDAADLVFQHLALGVADARSVWARIEGLGATAISQGGPVTLPASAGGVTAVKFRDPEGHPLELLQPRSGGPMPGGIDHSAISVADAGASRRFYAELGLVEDGATVNHGPTQAALDGVLAPVVDVVPMRPAVPEPHLELLGYRTPRGHGHPPLQPNDIAATRIVWAAERDTLLRDPDGHLHLLRRSD